MAQTKPRVQGSAQVSFEGGCDSNLHPRLLQENQTAWAVNCSVRGGSIGPRPGFLKRTLTFSGDAESKLQDTDTQFQGAGYYRGNDGRGEVLLSVGGRIFAIDPSQNFVTREVSADDDRNSNNRPVVTFEQAERWTVIQDGQNAPFLYN